MRQGSLPGWDLFPAHSLFGETLSVQPVAILAAQHVPPGLHDLDIYPRKGRQNKP